MIFKRTYRGNCRNKEKMVVIVAKWQNSKKLRIEKARQDNCLRYHKEGEYLNSPNQDAQSKLNITILIFDS